MAIPPVSGQTPSIDLNDPANEAEFLSLLSTLGVDMTSVDPSATSTTNPSGQFNVDVEGANYLPLQDTTTQPNQGYGTAAATGERARAAEMRAEAADMYVEADAMDAEYEQLAQGDQNAPRDLMTGAQVLRDRAKALEERAGTIEDRVGIRDEAQGRDPDEVRGYEPPVDSLGTSGAWADEGRLDMIQTELAATSTFADAVVSDARTANGSEVNTLLQLAEVMGADADSLELLDGYTDAFPLEFVFVDNLIEDFGMETATRGESNVAGGTTILMDSQFLDDDFTAVGADETAEGNASGAEAMVYSQVSILQGLDMVPYSGQAGDGDFTAELASGLPLSQWDELDQQAYISGVVYDQLSSGAGISDAIASIDTDTQEE